MYPTFTLEVLWGDEWRRLHTASTPDRREWLAKHMAALSASPERPAQALAYRITTPSVYAAEAPVVVERAA
jgi:hypothetical protein